MFVILEGSDKGESYPFVRLVTRDEFQKELDDQAKCEGLIHDYLTTLPVGGLTVGQRLVFRCNTGDPIIPVIEKVITKVRIP
jgi:hypothetical protein